MVQADAIVGEISCQQKFFRSTSYITDVCFRSLAHTMLYITEAWNPIFASQTDFDATQLIT